MSEARLMGERTTRLRRWPTQHPKAVTLTASVIVGGAVAVGLAGKESDFASAVGGAPIWMLSVAVCLHLVWLVARSEAWHVCVGAAGGTVERRRLYRAASVGYLGNLFNAQFGLGVRIAALRRSAPAESPEPAVLVAAELPIVLVEGALAALMSFTLVAPLGVPWWAPIAALTGMSAAIAGGACLARERRLGAWRGLAVLRDLANRNRIIALVVLAVSIQVARNWFLLHAVGVDVSVLNSVALLIAMAVVGLVPIGPSAGAATTVVILGANGVAAAAAAGALLTLTGVLATVAFAGWAAVDRLRPAAVPAPAPSG